MQAKNASFFVDGFPKINRQMLIELGKTEDWNIDWEMVQITTNMKIYS